MKKILIATIAGLALQVSISEAQSTSTRESEATKKYVEPPPAPPPPLAPPPPPHPVIVEVPPAPPAPQVPPAVPVQISRETELVAFNPPTIIKEVNAIGTNKKGYELSVRTVNNNAVVIVKAKGKIVKKVDLQTWLANKEKYEAMYGELPPPPPPPPPPAPIRLDS